MNIIQIIKAEYERCRELILMRIIMKRANNCAQHLHDKFQNEEIPSSVLELISFIEAMDNRIQQRYDALLHREYRRAKVTEDTIKYELKGFSDRISNILSRGEA